MTTDNTKKLVKRIGVVVFRCIRKWGGAGIMAAGILLLFWPYFRDKKVPIPIDIPVGMYYPWLNYSYGYPVRPPVKNPLLTDTVSQFWIWRNWAMEGIKRGEVRIWNPYSLAGTPMSPWFHTVLLSPVNLAYFLANEIDAMAWIVILQVAVGMAGGYFLARAKTSEGISAIAMATAWTTSTYFVGWLTWGTICWTLAILPWILFFLDKTIRERKSDFWLVASLAGAVLAGHPQTFFYAYLIVLVFFVAKIWEIDRQERVWAIVRFGLANVAVAGLTAAAWLPSIKILAESIRGQETILEKVNYGFIPWAKVLILALSPNFFGNPATYNYWGGDYNFQEKLVGFGIVPMIAALYWLMGIRKRPINGLNCFLLTTFLTGILLSTEYPVGWLVYRLKIPLISSGPAGRAMVMTIFSGCLMLAMMIKELANGRVNKKHINRSAELVVIMLAAALLCLKIGKFIGGREADDTQIYLTDFYRQLNTGWRNTLLSLAVATGAAMAVRAATAKRLVIRRLAIVAVLGLLFGENYLFFRKYTPFVERKLYFPRTPTIDFLTEKLGQEGGWFRVERESAEILPANMWQQFRLPSPSGYDPVYLKSYSEYLISAKMADNHSRYVACGNQNLGRIDELGVKYLMVVKRKEGEDSPDANGELAWWVDRKKWQKVFEEGAVAVLENRGYKKPYIIDDIKGEIYLIEKSDDRWLFETNSGKKSQVVVFENLTSDWEALIDGEKASIQKYAGTFKAVDLTPGKHSVEFVYRPKLWIVGRSVSLAFLAVLSTFSLLSFGRRHFRLNRR